MVLPEAFEEPTFEMNKKQARMTEGVPIKPKGSRVLVVRNSFKQKGRIYIPDTAQQKPTTGKVVAIGPDVPEDAVRLEEQVVFGIYAGTEFNIVDTEGNIKSFVQLHIDEVAGELLVNVDKLKLEGEG